MHLSFNHEQLSAVVTRDMGGAVREAVEVLELPANRQILEQFRSECIFFLHNSMFSFIVLYYF